MRCLAIVLTASLAVPGIVAGGWLPGTKAVFNKWHETELERWLSDHGVPFPTPADRKDLVDFVEKSWNDVVVEPYRSWDAAQLASFLGAKTKDAGTDAEGTAESLMGNVKARWDETEAAGLGWATSAKDWILDTCLLERARAGYDAAASKVGETVAYPGNWMYASWSDSDLRSWLETYGFPTPQDATRDGVIASVRRYSRTAHLKRQREAARARAEVEARFATLTDAVLDGWDESRLKEFCDENGIRRPQGTRPNELRALVRHRRDAVAARARSAFGAATSNAGNQYARATDAASAAARAAFDEAAGAWSESRLKAYLDARGIPVAAETGADDLLALVRKHAHGAATASTAHALDDFSRDNLKQYLLKHGDAAARAVAERSEATRDELLGAARAAYSSASTAGGAAYASATAYLASATAAVERDGFRSWSESDVKAYLDGCGVPVPQGSKLDELQAVARRQANYFRHGASSPAGTMLAKLGERAQDGWSWLVHQLKLGGTKAGAHDEL
ncbi:hypothetical protein RJ55_02423 [Drechmeria coniospora]|nr:hypothetical protein RJ55_02423 [Drechmeria coniospora]